MLKNLLGVKSFRS